MQAFFRSPLNKVVCFSISFEVSLDVAVGAVEHYGVGSAGRRCDGDDVGLLHGSVRHGAVDQQACTVVDADAHVAKALVEVDVDSVVVSASYDGVGAHIV